MPWSTFFDTSARSSNFNVYGDSLCAAGSSNWATFGMVNGFGAGKLINNNSQGGIGSATALANKILPDDALAGRPYCRRKTYIWLGENDMSAGGWDGSNTLANIATAVALFSPGWFRVLEILPKSLDSNYFTGGSKRVVMDSVNNQLAALYGSSFIRLIAALQAGGTGTGQDATDVANGVVPTSLRQPADTVHMTLMSSIGDGTGNAIVYNQVLAAA